MKILFKSDISDDCVAAIDRALTIEKTVSELINEDSVLGHYVDTWVCLDPAQSEEELFKQVAGLGDWPAKISSNRCDVYAFIFPNSVSHQYYVVFATNERLFMSRLAVMVSHMTQFCVELKK